MKKILITGGAGFIGSHLVDRLISIGYNVVIVDNLLSGRLEYINPASKFYLNDVRDDVIEKIFEIEKPDVVFHFAAQLSVPYSVINPVFDMDINIRGLLNVLGACVKNGISRFIFISSGGTVYGDSPEFPTSELSPLNPICPYGITKMTSEHYLHFFKYQYGLNYLVLRYANIYGPRQISAHECGVVTIFIENILRNNNIKIFRYDDQPEGMFRDYVYIDDVTDINVKALESNYTGAFNVGTAVPTSTYKLFELIKNYTKSEVQYDYGQPRHGDLPRNCLNNEKARLQLGWIPKIDLNTGIVSTIEYFRKELSL